MDFHAMVDNVNLVALGLCGIPNFRRPHFPLIRSYAVVGRGDERRRRVIYLTGFHAILNDLNLNVNPTQTGLGRDEISKKKTERKEGKRRRESRQ
jgi:hypothetical protein